MMIAVDIRTLLFNARVASCANRKLANPNYASGAHRRSPVATIYTVRLTVAARVALVGRSSIALSLGSASTSRITIAPEHTAQREAAMAASRSFVAT